ncbi:MAG: T9SS type A sorting domain-containing protein [Bacteroidales bacterium]|nr:T9SS type A sorting domain-containing protein [Bacteroidales bacterium]MBN2699633.1 T9SS type A sorting domain-containing protein [Bacteroidales bacterium]
MMVACVILFCSFIQPLFSIEKVTVSFLQDQELVYSAPVELHITNETGAMINSTVSLNHPDAWLFFDNIRPSRVIDEYLQYVRVNGQVFSNGGNGRIAIYAHGTVLMPHSAGFQPLTVYTDGSFSGDSMKCFIHTYYNNLGTFGRSMQSFKLKRGYMATFATGSDGSGYSRVFIADNEDIEMAMMPAELDATIAFIRVFKHQWVTKKGWCGTGGGADDDTDKVNGTWFYSWSADQASTNTVEYAVIKQNGGWPGWSEINNKTNVSHLLGFNEPDRPDQANMTMEAALAAWPDFMRSGLRIGSPATSDAFNSWSLFEFIDRCDELNYRVDFVPVHAYWVKSPQQWYNDLKYIHDRTGRPLWITEWNNGANWTNEWWPDSDRTLTDANAQKQLNDLIKILEVLDTTSFVERYSIYNWVQDCRAIILSGNLTPAGEYYADNNSRIAFNKQHEVIPPPWNYTPPVLSYQYLSLSNKINLRWTDSNENLTKGIRLEKRVNNESYQAIYESDDITQSSFSDDLNDTISGRISYRMSIRTVYGDYIPSNEVSYYQSQGDTTLQFGIFPYSNTDWNTTLFSAEFSEPPLIITGIPSFNNVTAMTHRVNAASTKLFRFQLDPWNYLNNPVLTHSENISILALPSGQYHFGRLKGESGIVEGVTGEWIPVTFSQTFESAPALFCTQVSNNTFFPTTPALRNVTTDGFEVSLRCEEKISASNIMAESLSYLAIEPGKGSIGNYRIAVGRNGEGGDGISSSPVLLSIDSSFVKPGLYAAMLTSADDFASTLRYYQSDDFEFTLLKQREMSGTLSTVKEDTLGWMIMDMAPGQIISGLSTQTVKGDLLFYPNPSDGMLYLHCSEPLRIEIFDLLGRKQMEKNAQFSLDLNGLPAGTYFLKAEGYRPAKFIKL